MTTPAGMSSASTIYVYPGSFETEALASGAIRVLSGEEEVRRYSGRPVWNGHVNNAWYLDWAAALLPEGAGPLRSLWIEYNRELREGQTAELSWQQEGDTLYVRGHVGRDESFTACLRCENA